MPIFKIAHDVCSASAALGDVDDRAYSESSTLIS